jgi:TP901-1 family phage major tail protein
MTIAGKDLILFFRRRKDHQTEDGSKLRFATEHSINEEKTSNSTMTKDGSKNSLSDGENTLDLSSLLERAEREATGDATVEVWKELRRWYRAGEEIEIWEVDAGSALDGEYDVQYMRGHFTSFAITAPADGDATLEGSYAINGNIIENTDVLTPAQIETIEANQYEYASIQATAEEA